MGARIAAQRIMSRIAGQGAISLPQIGDLWLAWSTQGLTHVFWDRRTPPASLASVRIYRRLPAQYARPFREYARGAPVDPAQIPIDLEGTPFQRQVWEALRTIPRGRLRTYAGVAADISNPRATRAVGMANGRNPVPIVVPCHRVVGARHKLGGYSGGLDRKRMLLALEGVEIDGEQLLPGQLALFAH